MDWAIEFLGLDHNNNYLPARPVAAAHLMKENIEQQCKFWYRYRL